MIEKLVIKTVPFPNNPALVKNVGMDNESLFYKINELVDAVNKLQKHEEQHLDLLTQLNEMRLHQNKEPAEENKMSLEDLLKQIDLIYDELKQLKPESTYIDCFNQRMHNVYTKNNTSPEVVYGVEFVLLWNSLDLIIQRFNNIVKQIQTKGGDNE